MTVKELIDYLMRLLPEGYGNCAVEYMVVEDNGNATHEIAGHRVGERGYDSDETVVHLVSWSTTD